MRMTTKAGALCALGLSALIGLGQTASAGPKAGTSGGAKSGKSGHHARRGGGAAQLQRLAATLKLSESQKAKLKPILQSAAQRAKAVRQNTALTSAQKKARMREIRASTRAAIEPILTTEQKRKLRQHRQETRKRQATRRAQKRAA